MDDITNIKILEKVIKRTRAEYILNCAAITDIGYAEKNPKECFNVNSIAVWNLDILTRKYNKKLIHLSSDYAVNPTNVYGYSKLISERLINKSKNLIIRTSFKPNGKWPYPEAFDDLYTSADYVDTITWKIEFLIKNKATGIYNVGTERKTIYDLARCRTPSVKPISKNSIRGVILPDDVSMNFDKYNQFYDSVNL